MIVRLTGSAVMGLLLLAGPQEAAAADFSILLGGNKNKAKLPHCTIARADVSRYGNQQYCWNGLRAELTWPNGLPVDRAAPIKPKKFEPPAPPPPSPEKLAESKREVTLNLIKLLLKEAESGVAPPPGGTAALAVNTFKEYKVTKRAGLPGHNRQIKDDIELIYCAESCNNESWCKSFDYHWLDRRCFLSDKSASDVPLKFDYPRTPYDYFEKKQRVVTAIPADNTPAPLLTPTTVCRKYLKGPNPWLNNQATTYSKSVTDTVCGPLESSTKPAECFHYVMSGQVAWDVKGHSSAKPNTYTRWGQQNAAKLCAGTATGTGLVQCFGLHVARHRNWKDAMARCKPYHLTPRG